MKKEQRLIDADVLKALMMVESLQVMLFGEKYQLSDALKTVNNAPTVDAVPVIRCKDCKYYTGKWCTRNSNKQLDENDRITTSMDYCSWAERKEA